MLGVICTPSNSTSAVCIPDLVNESPRVLILSDISNEPDDTQSLVRLLLHSDQVNIQGLIAVTSYWLNSSTYPDQILAAINAYGEVVDNLQFHTYGQYPSAAYLRSVVRSGSTEYGMAAVLNKTLSDGAKLLINAVCSSPSTLHVQVWGGANVLAEALAYARSSMNASELATFTSRLFVYSISDQDDAGPWIRHEFPSVRYIASVHGWNQYGLAAWCGISGEPYYHFDGDGPDTTLVTNNWVHQNIQLGPLGTHYPDIMYIMEGDTPSMLYNLPNGLNAPDYPNWGSWGGRYFLSDNSGHSMHYADAIDQVIGKDGKLYYTNHGTIWRWRAAYQAEFATRIQWSLTYDFSKTAHHPVVVVNSSCGFEHLPLTVAPNVELVLDASESYDLDREDLSDLEFTWWHYRDVTATQTDVDAEVPAVDITTIDAGAQGLAVKLRIPPVESACATADALLASTGVDYPCQAYHIILEVTKKSGFPLTRYKRIVLQVVNNSTLGNSSAIYNL
jgi:hypothetical protein